MASNIDASQPPALNPTTAAMRANMAAAKSEIEALQSNALCYCRVERGADSQNMVPGVAGAVTVNFANLIHESIQGMWDAANNMVLFAPALAAGFSHYRPMAQIIFEANADGVRSARIKESDGTILSGDNRMAITGTSHGRSSPDAGWLPIPVPQSGATGIYVTAHHTALVDIVLPGSVAPAAYFLVEFRKQYTA